MKENHTSAAWIVASILILVPLLYVGSYLAVVRPFAILIPTGITSGSYDISHYRFGGTAAETIYWPLEQLDRRIRPYAWGEPIYH